MRGIQQNSLASRTYGVVEGVEDAHTSPAQF
jgi:hypothetical protein